MQTAEMPCITAQERKSLNYKRALIYWDRGIEAGFNPWEVISGLGYLAYRGNRDRGILPQLDPAEREKWIVANYLRLAKFQPDLSEIKKLAHKSAFWQKRAPGDNLPPGQRANLAKMTEANQRCQKVLDSWLCSGRKINKSAIAKEAGCHVRVINRLLAVTKDLPVQQMKDSSQPLIKERDFQKEKEPITNKALANFAEKPCTPTKRIQPPLIDWFAPENISKIAFSREQSKGPKVKSSNLESVGLNILLN